LTASGSNGCLYIPSSSSSIFRKIVDLGSHVFPWPHHERTLYKDFARIQMAAKDENDQRIINMARQLDGAVQQLHVPELPEIVAK
jgi:hypothetical protein